MGRFEDSHHCLLRLLCEDGIQRTGRVIEPHMPTSRKLLRTKPFPVECGPDKPPGPAQLRRTLSYKQNAFLLADIHTYEEFFGSQLCAHDSHRLSRTIKRYDRIQRVATARLLKMGKRKSLIVPKLLWGPHSARFCLAAKEKNCCYLLFT